MNTVQISLSVDLWRVNLYKDGKLYGIGFELTRADAARAAYNWEAHNHIALGYDNGLD